jgi:hypothetical protein
VSVAVDKTRQNRSTAEIDYLGVLRNVTLHFCKAANFFDALALDPYRATFDVAALAYVEQFSSLH